MLHARSNSSHSIDRLTPVNAPLAHTVRCLFCALLALRQQHWFHSEIFLVSWCRIYIFVCRCRTYFFATHRCILRNRGSHHRLAVGLLQSTPYPPQVNHRFPSCWPCLDARVTMDLPTQRKKSRTCRKRWTRWRVSSRRTSVNGASCSWPSIQLISPNVPGTVVLWSDFAIKRGERLEVLDVKSQELGKHLAFSM
jgi:hypothetical protein